MSQEIAVRVSNVYKDFKLPHEKAGSVKTLFLNPFRKKAGSSEVQHALKDISFEIKKGEFFGIVGRNGSGKSTLLKLLAGIYQPTRGKLEVAGKLVPFIELGVGFNPELSGRENVYLNGALLGFSESEIDAMYHDIVQFAELEKFMDQKLKNYSSGMQVRLAFSMAVRAQADVLLIDEVLAVGDADFQRKCFEYFKKLKKLKKTVVFVSHDMSAVKEFCDRAVLIDNSEVIAEGLSAKVADKYSKLFIESSNSSELTQSSSQRWGTGEVAYRSVTARVSGDDIIVSATLQSTIDVESLLFGIHVSAPDGRELVATNNRLVGVKDMTHVIPGQQREIEWRLLNIFAEGTYDVTVTLADPVSIVYDWYIDATAFRVKRLERSATPVLPPMTATTKVKTP